MPILGFERDLVVLRLSILKLIIYSSGKVDRECLMVKCLEFKVHMYVVHFDCYELMFTAITNVLILYVFSSLYIFVT